jgi:transcriptional regulator with XRE-family HTH domain
MTTGKQREWAARMRVACHSKGMTLVQLADEIGMAASALYHLSRGSRTPTIQSAEAIATALDAPYLAAAAVEMRKKSCVVCGATFVDRGTTLNARCCGMACSRTLRARKDRIVRVESNAHAAIVARRRLRLYSDAVVAFCRACEPEGLCRSEACELRSVSPLPMATMRRTA